MESSVPSNKAAGPPVDTPQPSIFALMAGLFTSPTKTFQQYSQRPRIWAPLLVTMILVALSGLFTAKYQAMAQYDLMKKSTTLPGPALEDMRAKTEDPDKVSGAIIGAVVIVVIGVLAALLAWFIGTFIFGGETTFKGVWGAALMGGLVTVVGALVKLPLMIAKDSAQVTFGLAALMPGKDFTSILYSLLFYLDAFAVWGIIVTGIGYAAAFGITRGKGIATAAIVSVVFILMMIGLVSFGLGIAGVDVTFV